MAFLLLQLPFLLEEINVCSFSFLILKGGEICLITHKRKEYYTKSSQSVGYTLKNLPLGQMSEEEEVAQRTNFRVSKRKETTSVRKESTVHSFIRYKDERKKGSTCSTFVHS